MKPTTAVCAKSTSFCRRGLAVLVALSLATAVQAADPAESPIRPVTTTHKLVVGGKTVAYEATFAEVPLGADPSHPAATMSATTYLRKGLTNVEGRPVIFVFNGGPGASSTPLHLHALGPRRIKDPDDAHKAPYLSDNPYSLIDVADLVFIDPVGTGLSRVLPGGDAHPYWSPDGDAKAILGFIQGWLQEHHREQSPIYIMGESYGGYRLATMMKLLGDQRVDGLIFVSAALDFSASDEAKGNDQSFINNLPTMAAAAWYHNKVDRRGEALEAFVAEADAYAMNEYATALQLGDAITPEHRAAVAQKVASYIGLPADRIAHANLRIGSEDYLNSLIAEKDLRVGRLDARETGPLHAKAPTGVPTNDPSLHVSQKVGINDQYFRNELGVPTDRRYVGLSFEVNGAWNWADDKGEEDGHRFYVNAAPFIGDAARKQANMRVLLTGGLYDMATPWHGSRYAMERAGIPQGRLREVAFPSGHSFYDGDERLKKFSDLLRDFVQHPASP
ncbi:peptidase S10 [Dyella halodurans]|uniref:S10 family peptidase n=1 Tax=Dyella halodurans TaxID=1920171 RepID=A0ABV9C0G9_9GAMM|nr:hypothetical protein [Dyella halodurans]